MLEHCGPDQERLIRPSRHASVPERPRRHLGDPCDQVLRHIRPPVAAAFMLHIAVGGELIAAPSRLGSRLVV